MGPVRGTMLAGLGALGAFGIVSALRDGNNVAVPKADSAAAAADAQRTLDKVHWDRDVIVLSVPGTEWGLTHELVEGVEAQVGKNRASVVWVRYPGSASNMPASVAQGEATLQLVLEEIQRRDPSGTKYHVALHGESQGAWIINDVLGRTPFAKTVDRVDVFGLPSTANDDGALGRDPRAHVTNHPLDPIAWPFLGPASVAVAAPGFLIGGNWADAPAALLQIALNPIHGLAFAGGMIAQKVTGNLATNPHIYIEHYGVGADAPRRLLEGAAD